MPFIQSLDFLLISQAAAAAFAVARLLQFHLRRRFPFLFIYLIVTIISDTALSALNSKSGAYVRTFLIVSPATWCAESLAVFEMFALIFRDFPGLKTVGRWALYTALGISGIAAALVVRAPLVPGTANSHRVHYELGFDHSIHFSLAIIILILMLFLSRYPLRLDRNTYVASMCFSAVFLAQSAVRLIDTLSPRHIARWADRPEVGFTALCFVTWGVMLQSISAVAPERVVANKPRETELLQQLESLNSILSRAARG